MLDGVDDSSMRVKAHGGEHLAEGRWRMSGC